MKHDTRQFLSITQYHLNNMDLDHVNMYRYAIDDASKILKTISNDNFQIFVIWIYIGKLFLYSLEEAKRQGIDLRVIHRELLSLRETSNCEFSIESAKFEIEAFICDSIFKSSVQIEQLFSCFRKLGVTIGQIKTFSLAITAINHKNKEPQYLKDTLFLALFDDSEERPITIVDVEGYLIRVHKLIEREHVKLYYDHYKLL